MNTKDKLNLMNQIDKDNQKHVEDWKQQNMKIWVADYGCIEANGERSEDNRIQIEALTIREALEKAEEEIKNLALLGNWQFWKIWDVGMCNDNIW